MPPSRRTPPDLTAVLNPAQLQAVTAEGGAHLVVAGAGTGKTRTLVYRVAHRIAQGTTPESLLLLTFTRRAADEMLRRASAIVGDECRRVAGGTFHSFANAVLRKHARRLDYAPGFTILDASDAADVVGMVRTEGGFARSGRRFPRKDSLAKLFSKHVNTGRSLETLIADELPQFAPEQTAIADVMKRYTTKKREQNVLDYDDLLIGLRDLLAQHGPVRAEIGRRFNEVLVDEYQDTNRLQAHITALLGASGANLMVVGDEAQSIYGFRGADFRNIVDFASLFPDAAVTKLERNYRSTQPILDLANAVLAGAKEGFDKRLVAARDSQNDARRDDKPRLVRTEDEHAEARYIAERVLALREQGVGLAEIAVLARAGWHLSLLELALAERNIPFRKFGGLRFLEAAHVKDVLALLRLATNPRDAVAWVRVLQLAEGVGPATAQRLAQAVIEAGGDLAPLRAKALGKRRYARDVGEIARAVAALSKEGVDLPNRIEQALAIYRKQMPARYDDAEARARDLESLPVIASRYDSLEAFLGGLAIEPPQTVEQQADDPEDEVLTLSTIHSAKGLEWHTVFIVGLVAGQFPSRAADGDAYEEERRLLYVAVTRARRSLVLMRSESMAQRGGWGHRLVPISPLLAELDLESLVDEEIDRPPDDGFGSGGDGGAGEDPGDDEALRRIQAYFGDG